MHETIIVSSLFVIIIALFFILGILAYPKLKNEKQGYKFEAELESLLLPYLYTAIVSAYKVSEQAFEKAGLVMTGIDKKAFADVVYTMLPNRIGGYDISIIKSYISQERFQVLVQNTFDNANQFVSQQGQRFNELFEEWLRDNQ